MLMRVSPLVHVSPQYSKTLGQKLPTVAVDTILNNLCSSSEWGFYIFVIL